MVCSTPPDEAPSAPDGGRRPRFSLVVPAYNERRLLPRLLDSVEVARRAYPGGGDAIEVIVADNASTDETAEIARRRGCRVVRVERRCIASARNGGAAVARGELLCFVDADSVIHRDTFGVVERSLTEEVVGGTSTVAPERWSLGLRVTYALIIGLLVVLRMDSGLAFCRRRDFEALGGYDESLLFAEDVAFLFALRRLGKARGQRLIRLPEIRALTSVRKYDAFGQWHFLTALARHAVLLKLRPQATEEFARRYWYSDR